VPTSTVDVHSLIILFNWEGCSAHPGANIAWLVS